MNRNDMIDLLTAVAAGDRRQVGEADITAWTAVIGDLGRDEALAAVVVHRRERPGVWLEPGHLLAIVRAARIDQGKRDDAAAARAVLADPRLVPMPEEVRRQLVRIRDSWSAPIRMNTPDRGNQGAARRRDRVETDADRARNGHAITVCFRCACDVPVPAGWNPRDREAPPVHCQPCTAALNRQGAAS